MKNKFLLSAAVAALASLTAAAAVRAGPDGRSGLLVHEWGTFTSFSGSDGTPLVFMTLPRADLPGFVAYTGGKPNPALQRMETPVTYFYASAPMDVGVGIGFPEGSFTEHYPLAPNSNTK